MLEQDISSVYTAPVPPCFADIKAKKVLSNVAKLVAELTS